MKQILACVLCGLMLSLTACSNSTVSSPTYPTSIAFDDYAGKHTVLNENKLDPSYVEALNSFTYSSASSILKNQSSNLIYSPISLYMALSLAVTGADGSTQQEILTALGLCDKNSDYLSEQNGKLFRLLYSNNEISKLKIANSLWLQNTLDFKKPFINNAQKNFYAALYNVNFADSETSKLMSKWISENTNNLLSPDIDIDTNQIISILNTIYFKDEWTDKFIEAYTKPDKFYLSDGSQVECDFMNMSYGSHTFYKCDGFTSSSLSLKGFGSMIFILPDKGVSIDALVSTSDKIASLFETQDGQSGKVIFQIPKFSFGNEISLKGTLTTMGIRSAFAENADFSNMIDSKAYISSIKQQTHIAIDEKGVEAAAFTEMNYCGSAMAKDTIAEMILNRPFIWGITSPSGTLLFVGIINNPTIFN